MKGERAVIGNGVVAVLQQGQEMTFSSLNIEETKGKFNDSSVWKDD